MGSGVTSPCAIQALLSRISLESNPGSILDNFHPFQKRGTQSVLKGTKSDMESIWRSEISSISSLITFCSPRDIQPICSVTESGIMILEGSNLNQAIEVCNVFKDPLGYFL
jgi:hypothetical protein